ncbi:hypothetical protein D3C75_1133070 [compost metagenome]
MRLGFSVQPGDGVASANGIESDVLAVVTGEYGLPIQDFRVLLAIHFNDLELHCFS